MLTIRNNKDSQTIYHDLCQNHVKKQKFDEKTIVQLNQVSSQKMKNKICHQKKNFIWYKILF